MIGIKVNDTFLKLDPQTRVALEYYNPMFSDAVMQGDYGLPVNIPYKGNAYDLQWVHNMHLTDRTLQYINSKLYFNKTGLSNGVMDIQSVDDNYVTASFRLNMGALSCMSRKLKDLYLGGERDLGDDMSTVIANANAITVMDSNDTDFNFPMIYNPEFYGDKNPDYAGFMNNFEPGVGYYDNTGSNRNCLVPMVYLRYLIKQGFAADDYTVNTNIHGLGEMIVYNNRAIDKRESAVALKGFFAGIATYYEYTAGSGEVGLVFDIDSPGPYFNHDSCYDTTTGVFTVISAGIHSFKMKLDVRKILAFLPNDTIEIKVYHDAVVVKTVTMVLDVPVKTVQFDFSLYFTSGQIGSNVSVTVSAVYGFKVLSTSWWKITNTATVYGPNEFDGKVLLNNHVPDITFGALLNAVRQTFNLDFVFDHGRRDVTIQTQGYDPSQRDWNSRKIVGHKINFGNDKKIRSFNFTFGSDDGLVTDNFKVIDSKFILGEVSCLTEAEANYAASEDLENKILLLENLNQYWRCEQQLDTSWQWVYYTDNYYERIVDSSGTKDVRPELAPLFMKDHVTDYATMQHYVTPAISQKGSSTEFDIGENAYGLRLLHFHSDWSSAMSNIQIPFSTVTNRDGMGNEISYLLNLAWLDDGKDSLTELWNELVLALSRGEWFEVKLRLYLMDLINYSIAGYYHVNNQKWLMESVKVEIGEDIGEASCVMLKM